MNLTPVSATAPGDGQLIPINVMRNPPVAANVNFGPGTVDPNVTFTRIGSKSNVCFANSRHASVELIADQMGTLKGRFYQFAQSNGAPKRVLDSRGGPIIRPRQNRCFRVAGRPGDIAVVNLTPVGAQGSGDGQLVSSNIKNRPPVAANVNFGRGTVDPNVALARIGNDNKVCFINSRHTVVHLIADHLGTIKGGVYSSAQPNGAPKRVMDTRNNTKIPPSGSRCFKVAGSPGDIAVVNLTPINADRPGDGQLVSSDIRNNPPVSANVNFGRGTVDPNVAVSKIGGDNKVCFINSRHSPVNVIADHLGTIKRGAFTPARPNGGPFRLIDTRTEAEITPIAASGPHALTPSNVSFACGYIVDGSFAYYSRRVRFNWGNVGASNQFRITFLNDPFPNDGKNLVINSSAGSSIVGYTSVPTIYGPPSVVPYKGNWNGRLKIELFIGSSRYSSTTFDVADKCFRGRLTPRGNGDNIAVGEADEGVLEATTDGELHIDIAGVESNELIDGTPVDS